jgi:hypothetical protein
MLYVLADNDIGGNAVHEVFLYGENLDGWQNHKRSHSSLFYINRAYQTSHVLTGIYVDENYLYTLSPEGNYLYERGIPRGSSLPAAKPFIHGSIHNVHKVLVDGLPFILSLSKQSLIEFRVAVSDPHIRCPPRTDHKTFDIFGKYVFELNATVKNCPLKISQSYRLGMKRTLDYPCVLRTTFEIEYFKSDKQSSSLFLKLIGIIAIIALVLLVFVVVTRLRISKLNKEHEILRQEIKHYKDKNAFEVSKLSKDQNRYKLNRSTDSLGTAENKNLQSNKTQIKTDEDHEDNIDQQNKLDVSAEA